MNTVPPCCRWLVAVFSFTIPAITIVAPSVLADTTPVKTPRKYADGPLKIDEFRGKPDQQAGGDAYTECTVEFRFNYSYEKHDNLFVATLTSFDAYSVFLPQKSWWKKRTERAVLDHEQGHFDIAEVTALRLQLAFEEGFKSNRSLQAKGATLKAATTALRTKLDKIVQLSNEHATQENLDYDSSTRHGIRFRRQSEQRRIQKATLQRLNTELATVRKKATRNHRATPSAR